MGGGGDEGEGGDVGEGGGGEGGEEPCEEGVQLEDDEADADRDPVVQGRGPDQYNLNP